MGTARIASSTASVVVAAAVVAVVVVAKTDAQFQATKNPRVFINVPTMLANELPTQT